MHQRSKGTQQRRAMARDEQVRRALSDGDGMRYKVPAATIRRGWHLSTCNQPCPLTERTGLASPRLYRVPLLSRSLPSAFSPFNLPAAPFPLMLGAAHCVLHMPEREDDGLKAYAARNCQLESQGNKKLRQIALELEPACDPKLWSQVEHNRHCCTDRPGPHARCKHSAPHTTCAAVGETPVRYQATGMTAVGHAERLSVTEAIR